MRLCLAGMLLTSVSFAQNGAQCTASVPKPLVVRGEGFAERLGDVIINCTGSGPSTADITLNLAFNFTSRIIDPALNLSEAMLLVDEPQSLIPGSNVFFGSIDGPHLRFYGIPIGRVLRLTNVRGEIAPLAAFGNPQVNESVQISGGVVVADSFVTAGYYYSTLAASLARSEPAHFSQCGNRTAQQEVGTLQFNEKTPSAFKTRADESGLVFAEDGYVAGLADFGTRLKAVFHGIPAGVRLFVSTGNDSAVLVPNESYVFDGPMPAASAAIAELPVSNGEATAVWEITKEDPVAMETLSFGVWQQFAGRPNVGTITVSMSYAPTPPAADARFANTSYPQELFSIAPCKMRMPPPPRRRAQ